METESRAGKGPENRGARPALAARQPSAMLHSLLNVLPMGGNMKVFFGVSLLLGLSYMPLYLKKNDAVAYETMADKRAAQKAAKEREVAGAAH